MPSTRLNPPSRGSDEYAEASQIFDLVHGSTEDGPGLRTVVFLKGCPLRCVWCHNPESQDPRQQEFTTSGDGVTPSFETIGRVLTPDEVADEILRDASFYRVSGGGVTFSGGEPMMHMRLLEDVCAAIKDAGVHVAVDTCGQFDYAEYERRLAGTIDLFLYDLKLMDDEQHRMATGASNAVIHANLIRLAASDVAIHVRVPLIPGYTATRTNLSQIAEFATEHHLSKVSLLPYNPSGIEKWRKLGIAPPVLMPTEPMHMDEYSNWVRFFRERMSDLAARIETDW